MVPMGATSLDTKETGRAHMELKGKGIPTKVLKMTKTYDDYYRMLDTPYNDWGEFNRIGCKRQRLEHYTQCKKGLGSFNDKVFQFEPMHSRPLGHWRNAPTSQEPEEIVPVCLRTPTI